MKIQVFRSESTGKIGCFHYWWISHLTTRSRIRIVQKSLKIEDKKEANNSIFREFFFLNF